MTIRAALGVLLALFWQTTFWRLYYITGRTPVPIVHRGRFYSGRPYGALFDLAWERLGEAVRSALRRRR